VILSELWSYLKDFLFCSFQSCQDVCLSAIQFCCYNDIKIYSELVKDSMTASVKINIVWNGK